MKKMMEKSGKATPGAKVEGRIKNDEMAGRAPKATLKPHQCDIKATPKRVDSQLIGTPEPPQCDSDATPMRPQCDPKATSKHGEAQASMSSAPLVVLARQVISGAVGKTVRLVTHAVLAIGTLRPGWHKCQSEIGTDVCGHDKQDCLADDGGSGRDWLRLLYQAHGCE
jgi:hypothetical protein